MFVSICKRWVCIFNGILFILFKNNVLLLVCLKWFWWVVWVLVNVFFLWLNSFDFIRLVGMVVILRVMKGLFVFGLCLWRVCVISFLFVFDCLLISMLIEEWDKWFMVWNIFCMVGVLLIIFVIMFLICVLDMVDCFLVCVSVCWVKVIVLLILNGFGKYLKVFFWYVLIVLFKFECVVIMIMGSIGCEVCILFSNVMLFICGIFMFEMMILGVWLFWSWSNKFLGFLKFK